MRIIIEPRVHQAIDSFYDAALFHHWHTLSYENVEERKKQLYTGIRSLKEYHSIFGTARLKQEWIEAGWQEFVCNDFHFAYEVLLDKNGETMIIIKDAVHSMMYY